MVRYTLPYGTHPCSFELPGHFSATLVESPGPATTSSKADLPAMIDQALDNPIAAPRLDDVIPAGARVLIAVSDATRDDPRQQMLQALLARMPGDIELTIGVANGTHGPCDLARLGIASSILARARVINHDAHDDRDMVTIATTQRGTPVRIHRAAVEADWLIATGRIKPHYFAGYGAGCKAIFPGLGGNREIRINHRLKTEPGARPGVIDGNPCRADLEEAVAMLPGQKYLLNLVLDDHGNTHAAVAGDLTAAFRVGARICEPLFRVSAPRARVVIVSDRLPLTASLYQASKLVAAAAGLLRDDGTMIVAAECPEGTGPIDTVNRAIYEIGLLPRLPARHRIILVSGLDRQDVAASYCEWAASLEMALTSLGSEAREARGVTILPCAGSLIIDPHD